MKTFLTIIITAILTWLAFALIHGVNTGIERLWLVSAIKVPGQKAIDEIRGNLEEGRSDLAKAKLQVFSDTWRRFNNGPDAFSGSGIGDILLSFANIETNYPATLTTNQSPQLLSGTNNIHSN